jgi:tyrosinase
VLAAVDIYNVDKHLLTVNQGDGVQLPDTSLNAIRIEVYSQTARVPCDSNAPIRYKNNTVTHTEVTAGKLGGADFNCN